MVNPRRGEVALAANGTQLPMRLTLGALAELEASFSVDNLTALGDRFGTGQLSARDITRVLAAGLRGAGAQVSDADVADFVFDEGLPGAIRAAVTLLEVTFGAGERPTVPPGP